MSVPARRSRCLPALLAAVALAGCGSATPAALPAAATPPPFAASGRAPAGSVGPLAAAPASVREAVAAAAADRQLDAPVDDGRLQAGLDPRRRELTIRDGATGAARSRTPVGIGPTRVACIGAGLCYVLDTRGDGLLVCRVARDGRSVRVTRRVWLAGGPSALAVDRPAQRAWVLLPGRGAVAELAAHGLPHVLSVRPVLLHARSVAVDPVRNLVVIAGGGRVQMFGPEDPDRIDDR